MLHLQSIHISSFKGISDLQCEFDDLTVLVGPNNSGKTTVLQAIYLLMTSLKEAPDQTALDRRTSHTWTFGLTHGLGALGLNDLTWLKPFLDEAADSHISGEFASGMRARVALKGGRQCEVTVSFEDPAGDDTASGAELMGSARTIGVDLVLAPGIIPTREQMLPGNEYESQLRQGRGAQLWRNGIFWGVQRDGYESFQPVQELVKRHFPNLELLVPTLDPNRNPPEILMKYREGGQDTLDIAQSGGGIHTFVSLARVLEQSPAQVILLDEPDAHLHSRQQAAILDLLLEAAAEDRQVILATHSPELIVRAPTECLRWLELGKPKAVGGPDTATLLDRLGVHADALPHASALPDVVVYVEGRSDRAVLEDLIKWCRSLRGDLPSTLVVPHREGRFDASALSSIARVAREVRAKTRVVSDYSPSSYFSRSQSRSAA